MKHNSNSSDAFIYKPNPQQEKTTDLMIDILQDMNAANYSKEEQCAFVMSLNRLRRHGLCHRYDIDAAVDNDRCRELAERIVDAVNSDQ